MKPIVVTVTIPADAFVSQVSSAEEIVDGPDATLPELQALHHYSGRWELEIAGRRQFRRTEVAEWVLGGRFLRQCWSTEGAEDMPKASGITMMTFDSVGKVYLSWSFLAIGSVVHNKGIWDDASRTMTWTDQLAGTGECVITKSSFIDDGTNVWSITERDAKGEAVREIDGKSILRSA